MGCVQWGRVFEQIERRRLHEVDRVLDLAVDAFRKEVQRLEDELAVIRADIVSKLDVNALRELSADRLSDVRRAVVDLQTRERSNLLAIHRAKQEIREVEIRRAHKKIADDQKQIHRIQAEMSRHLQRLGAKDDRGVSEAQRMIDRADDRSDEMAAADDEQLDIPDIVGGNGSQESMLEQLTELAAAYQAKAPVEREAPRRVEPAAQVDPRRVELGRLPAPPAKRPDNHKAVAINGA